MSALASIPGALAALRAGRPVLVTDDEDRENEGDVVLAAQTLTDEWLAWTIRHSSGYLCAPVTGAIADRLGLPLMVADNRDPLRTAYTVTVDAAGGVTTGISAAAVRTRFIVSWSCRARDRSGRRSGARVSGIPGRPRAGLGR